MMVRVRFSLLPLLLVQCMSMSMVSGLGLYETMQETHWWCCTDAFCGQSCCASGKVPSDDPVANHPPTQLMEDFFDWGATGLDADPLDPPDANGYLTNWQVWSVRRYAAGWCDMKFGYTCDVHIPTDPPPICSGTGSGDPHFKTWTGEKFDYHGECDLVLIDNPTFNNGQGLKLHIRTTRVNYFSFIERVALKIGDDVLEFANDAQNFLINGKQVEANKKHHKTLLGGFIVRRDPKALSIRLTDADNGSYHSQSIAKIDLVTRKNGFPAVIVDAGDSTEKTFQGSLGLLGQWPLGLTLARDGNTQMQLEHKNATEYALEWQVRDTEPMLFHEARFPQYPNTCTPPAKIMNNRLGMSNAKKEAEEACAHWGRDKEDCIFDVIATRDVMVAQEGNTLTVG